MLLIVFAHTPDLMVLGTILPVPGHVAKRRRTVLIDLRVTAAIILVLEQHRNVNYTPGATPRYTYEAGTARLSRGEVRG